MKDSRDEYGINAKAYRLLIGLLGSLAAFFGAHEMAQWKAERELIRVNATIIAKYGESISERKEWEKEFRQFISWSGDKWNELNSRLIRAETKVETLEKK